jgi:hypothetical protein
MNEILQNDENPSFTNTNNLNHLYSLNWLLNSEPNDIKQALGININHVNHEETEEELCRICFGK